MRFLLDEELMNYARNYQEGDNFEGIDLDADQANYLARKIRNQFIPQLHDGILNFRLGDTVFSTDPETQYSAKVVDFYLSTHRCIKIEWEDGEEDWVRPNWITHTEPTRGA